MISKQWFAYIFVFASSSLCWAAHNALDVSIVTDKAPGKPVLHALTKLTNVLADQKITFERIRSLHEARGKSIIVTGLAYTEGNAAQLLQAGNRVVPREPEALTVWKTAWQEKPVWVVGGFDDRGLMYGLLDVANRIGWATDRTCPLADIKEITETPDVSERAVSIYTMQRRYWENRLYDEAYWQRYLDMLAKNRFNSLVVIFGYENGGFLAPCYPYFFDVERFPEIKMVGLTAQQQQRNLEAFNRLIQMCHDRGLKFKVGIWDHIYRGGVQTGGLSKEELATFNTSHIVEGVNAKNLIPYTKAALAKFIKLVPNLDGIQFRMHGESGVTSQEQESFWRDVFQFIKVAAPEMQFTLRAKNMKESVIQNALDVGVKFNIGTKYWMEQMGMPYHPPHINRRNQFDRRHGYADMLRYPQEYKIHWRLWNGGTTRILLWGNPDYARRFAASTHLYDGDGFEINEMLATKMLAQPHDAVPFDLLKPSYHYYDYEFERYWYFYQVFGRIAYNPQTSAEVWQQEFQQRFGNKTAPIIEKALHQASWILPRIVASVYHYDSSFPTTRGWPEKQRLQDLPIYASGEGSDIQIFASFNEEAERLIEDGETVKILPSMSSRWFEQRATEITQLIAEAEKSIGKHRNKEFDATIADLKILSSLALYHARRIPAAVSYRLFERTKDVSALDEAICHERSAIEAWRQIITAAEDVYADDLLMGVRKVARGNNVHKWHKELSGHWKDELVLLEQGLKTLEQQKKNFKIPVKVITAPRYEAAARVDNSHLFNILHEPILSASVHKPLRIRVKASTPAGVKWIRLRYRSVNQKEDYWNLQMTSTGEKNHYQAVVPVGQIIPQFDFMYFIEVMDNNGKGMIYPDFNKVAPYHIVKLVR